jgi:hypothetical protein
VVFLIGAVNLSVFEPALSADYRQSEAQLKDLRQFARPQDAFVAMTQVEPIIEWVAGHPFDRNNRECALQMDWAVSPMEAGVSRWRNRLARRALEDWSHGWDVWVEKSAMADRPNEASLWVEGDNPAIHWRDLPAFFRGLDFDTQTRRADGFMRLAHTQANQSRLLQFANLR